MIRRKNFSNTTFGKAFWKASVFSVIAVPRVAFCLMEAALVPEEAEEVQELNLIDTSETSNSSELNSRLQNGVSQSSDSKRRRINGGTAAPSGSTTDGNSFAQKEQTLFLSDDAVGEQQILVEETQKKTTFQEGNTGRASNPMELNSRLQVGANYTYVTLKPHGYSSFDGSLGGLQALYEYRPMNSFYGGAKFAWRDGSTHGSGGKRSLFYFDVQERLGYTFAFEKREWLLTLFSGFAYRYYGQTLTPNRGRDLKFRYNEFYFPVGVLTNYDLNSWFSLGLDFTWMPQVYPTVSIVPLKGARWVITNRLDNFFVEIPLAFRITKDNRSFLIVKPFYEHWVDGHSTAKLPNGRSLGLPGNTYNFYGIDLNFAYSF